MKNNDDKWEFLNTPFERMKYSYPDPEDRVAAAMNELYRLAMRGNCRAAKLWIKLMGDKPGGNNDLERMW